VSTHRIHLFSEFTLDLARGCVTRCGEPVHLRPQSYEVLKYLVENKGCLVSKDKLIEEVWRGRAVTDGSLVKCIEEVREALGTDARQYLRNVRGRGYIFDVGLDERAHDTGMPARSEQVDLLRVIVEDEEETNGKEFITEATAPSVAVGRTGFRSRTKTNKTALAGASLLIITATAIVGYRLFLNRLTTSASITSIAVLPFQDESGNPDIEYLSDGVMESLINSLSRLPRLSVKSRLSVFRYKAKEIDPQKIASELSVQALVNGRVLQRGDNLTLYLSLVDGRTGNQIWGEQYDRKSANLLALQREIARDITENLRLRLTTAEEQRLIAQGTENSEAYKEYLRGLYYWNRGSPKSVQYFQQAIDLDPNYSLGYAGLAHAYALTAAVGMLPPNENWPKAEAALTRALALDDRRAETYNVLAGIQLYYQRDWPAAERSFRHGIELNPNSAPVHHHYGQCLYLFGRNDEAIAEFERAIELEPFSIVYNVNLGRLYFFLRQYDLAIEQFRKTTELEPNSGDAHDWLGKVYQKKGLTGEAITEWSRALILEEQSDQAATLERDYASSGFEAAIRGLGQHQLDKLNDRVKRGEYVPAIAYVDAYVRLADKVNAFAWLGKALEERNRFAFELRISPFYDSLRSDARFDELLRRAGLPSGIHSARKLAFKKGGLLPRQCVAVTPDGGFSDATVTHVLRFEDSECLDRLAKP